MIRIVAAGNVRDGMSSLNGSMWSSLAPARHPERRLGLAVFLHELLQLRTNHKRAVGSVWILREIILMIIFRRIEFLQRHNLGRDRVLILRGSLLLHLLGGRFLRLIGIQNDRAILRAAVRALAIQRRRIV